LSGRVALVTGAGRYIGRAVAEALAARGAKVAVNDLHADRADEAVAAIGTQARGFAADITDFDAVGRMVRDIEASLGPIDILVNNAGIPDAGFPPKPFREMSVEEWRKFVDLNLYGTMYVTRAVLDGMCDRGWGRVILISSEAWRTGSNFGISIYGAAKAGALGFMRHLAAEVGGEGVTANAVALGIMDNLPGVESLTRSMPIARPGNPADVSAAVVYLASDEASWVTGQTIAVNGGQLTV
jgi:NAD(P)-dependent dehydrogenase (short-subunit alcohol dehydrogenase family)